MWHRDPCNRCSFLNTCGYRETKRPQTTTPHSSPRRAKEGNPVSVPLCAPSHLQYPWLPLAPLVSLAPNQPARLLCNSHSCAQCGGSLFVACERRAGTPGRYLNGQHCPGNPEHTMHPCSKRTQSFDVEIFVAVWTSHRFPGLKSW